jgi:RNA-directed DNA polymerase
MATRTTITRTTSGACAPSADLFAQRHAELSFADLVQADTDCRRTKRTSPGSLAFEIDRERNLYQLYTELRDGTYQPGRSICFVITHPRPREVWAAPYRDRVVHHALYNHVGPAIEARFIADSCACIKGRGTLYGAQRLEQKARSITQNWTRPAHYLKCDLANFFVSIDKKILGRLLGRHIQDPWWRELALQILFHDPRENFEMRGSQGKLQLVPPHKRLAARSSTHGLPIGNLSSQFFANIYLNELDQFIKHELKAKHYIRYVDDFVLLHGSPQWLNQAHWQIEGFLAKHLDAALNPSKTILQPAHRGIDFVGQVILPHRRVTRRRTMRHALRRVATVRSPTQRDTINSYFGLIRQASHHHDACLQLAREVLRRGYAVDYHFTKTY